MKFAYQQWLIVGLGVLVCSLNTLVLSDQIAENLSEYRPVLANFFVLGVFIVFFPFARWLSRLVVLGGLRGTFVQRSGQTADKFFVCSDFSKINRWFFHVDEFGCDLDLKKKLKSKIER